MCGKIFAFSGISKVEENYILTTRHCFFYPHLGPESKDLRIWATEKGYLNETALADNKISQETAMQEPTPTTSPQQIASTPAKRGNDASTSQEKETARKRKPTTKSQLGK